MNVISSRIGVGSRNQGLLNGAADSLWRDVMESANRRGRDCLMARRPRGEPYQPPVLRTRRTKRGAGRSVQRGGRPSWMRPPRWVISALRCTSANQTTGGRSHLGQRGSPQQHDSIGVGAADVVIHSPAVCGLRKLLLVHEHSQALEWQSFRRRPYDTARAKPCLPAPRPPRRPRGHRAAARAPAREGRCAPSPSTRPQCDACRSRPRPCQWPRNSNAANCRLHNQTPSRKGGDVTRSNFIEMSTG